MLTYYCGIDEGRLFKPLRKIQLHHHQTFLKLYNNSKYIDLASSDYILCAKADHKQLCESFPTDLKYKRAVRIL